MPKTPQSTKGEDDQFQRDIDELFSRANPNPNRVGCPPREMLAMLARRQQPIADPAYVHLAKCSPCFREVRALQEEFAQLRAEVDLRRFAVLRSEQAPGEPEPVSLPRSATELVILLPAGTEPGSYDVQLLDGDLRSRTDARGTAGIEDFVTTLRVRVELGQLAVGQYQLAVRRVGDSWQMFPAVVN